MAGTLVPLTYYDGYIIAFQAHYGYQGKKFCAEVSLWRGGTKVTNVFLGDCDYKREGDFYTTYATDYFVDMVYECFLNLNLPQVATAFRNKIRSSARE